MKPLAGKTGNSSLSEHDVRMIRQAGKKTPTRQLAEAYGIGVETVRKILRRETWQWVKDAMEEDVLEKQAKESEARMAKLYGLQAEAVGRVEEALEEVVVGGRVIPASPLDGGDGGLDETGGVGVRTLERALANDKAALL
jgi:hypothetical protein